MLKEKITQKDLRFLMKKINTLLVGLGNMGMMYDYNNIKNISHANCLKKLNNKFEIIGAVDRSSKKLDLFKEKFNKPTFKNLKDSLVKMKPDFIIISTSTKEHIQNIKDIAKYGKTKIILCEKPCSKSLRGSKIIQNISKKSNMQIFVNYLRINERYFISTIKKIKRQNLTFNIFYDKGLLVNASHFINFFFRLFGKPKIINVRYIKKIKKDFKSDFRFEYSNVIVNFFYHKKYKNEFELKTKNKMFKFSSNNKNNVNKNKIRYIKSYGNDLNLIMLKNIYNFFERKDHVLCSLKDAINTHGIVEKIKNA